MFEQFNMALSGVLGFIKSRKGSDMIIHEGFCTERTKKWNTFNWRCAGCKGSFQYRQQQEPPSKQGRSNASTKSCGNGKIENGNTVKTAAVATWDPPQRIVQDAIAHVNEEIAAAVCSSINLRQTFRQNREAADNNPPAPGTVGELLIPDQ